jgi:ribosomal-protein-alanine N-acetyltransferase
VTAPVGNRVRLAAFSERHITPEYIGWLNDRHLMRFSRQRLRTHDAESCLEFLNDFAGTPHQFWSVERVADGLAVGTITAYVDTASLTADMGILIGHPSASGTGCGREAWGLALQQGFETLGLRKITGGTPASHRAMVRIFQHWRMTLEGTQRQQVLLDDGPDDTLLFGLLREDWASGTR